MEIQMQTHSLKDFDRRGDVKDVMAQLMKRAGAAITILCLLAVNVMVAGCGSSGDDNNNNNNVVATMPTAPTGVAAVGGDTQVTVSWTAVAGATSYNVYRSTTNPVTIAAGTKVTVTTTSSVQTGLVNGTPYFFIVTAVNSAGESVPSLQVTATPSAPIGVIPAVPTGVAAVGGATQVTVSWTAVTGATSYNVYRSTINPVVIGAGTTVLVNVATTPSVQTGLVNGTPYFFVVTAVDAVGESAPSVQVTATPSAVVALSGAALFTANCSSCHGGSLDPANSAHIIGSNHQGASAALITAGIAGNIDGMGTLFNATNGTSVRLSVAQIAAISAALNP